MFSMFLLRMWPALIPLIFYLLWLSRKKKKHAAAGEALPPDVFHGPLFWTVVASILLMLASFLLYGAMMPAQHGTYVPPHYDGKTLSPAHIDPEQK